jgi:streptogrisin D
LRSRHKKITKTKVLVAIVAAAAAGATVVMLPQANAARTEQTARSTAETLRRDATIPGTAWVTDPQTGQVVVTADSTVTGAKWDSLMSTVRSMGGNTVRVDRSPGEFRVFAEGGDAIFTGNARCSLGFNVTTSDGEPGFLTAGHCAAAGRKWSLSSGGRPVATVQVSTFPGNGDFALLTYDDSAAQARSLVDIGGGRTVRIRRAAEATVNQRVSRMGSTTGLKSGRVTGLDATVNYPEGTVTGLIQTSVCAEGGDSGGSLFTQDGSAIGLTSGGSGDCRTGGVTFFQPVTTALEEVGAEIDGG